VKASAFGKVDNFVTLAKNFGEQTEHYDGFEAAVNARFGKSGLLKGGVSTARTVADNCFAADRPDLTTMLFGAAPAQGMTSAVSTNLGLPGQAFCKQTLPWSAQAQVKASAVYPLPLWGLETATAIQNVAGPADRANLFAANSVVRASSTLGRDLGECAGAANCAAVVGFGNLFTPNTLFEKRLTQVDFRVTKNIPIGRARMRASFDIYNLFNANSVLNINPTYGTTWPRPLLVLAARLFKFGGTIDF